MAAQRHTKQRQIIVSCIMNDPEAHFTAEQLTELARAEDPAIGRATVYRCLKQLHESGVVRRYTMPDGASACWQYVGEHSACHGHYHLKCNVCGQVLHVDSEVLDKLSDTLKSSAGFVVDEGETVIYGKCAACAENKED